MVFHRHQCWGLGILIFLCCFCCATAIHRQTLRLMDYNPAQTFSFPFTAVKDESLVFDEYSLQTEPDEDIELEETYIPQKTYQKFTKIASNDTLADTGACSQSFQKIHTSDPKCKKFSLSVAILAFLLFCPQSSSNLNLFKLMLSVISGIFTSFIISYSFPNPSSNFKSLMTLLVTLYLGFKFLPVFTILYWLHKRVGSPLVFLLFTASTFVIGIAAVVAIASISCNFGSCIYDGISQLWTEETDRSATSRSGLKVGDRPCVYR